MECVGCGKAFNRLKGSHTRLCSTECRFLSKVTVASPDACWEWTGSQDGKGYGQMKLQGRSPIKAHRIGYELFVESIPEGLTLDHLCRNRSCVNPDHLEPVTIRENTLRGMAPGIVTLRTGVCQRGHSMDNAIIKPNGARTCRVCENERQRRYYQERTNA